METINRVNRQTTEWETIFQNHVSDKKLVSKIHKEFLQPNNNSKELNYLTKKLAKNLSRHFSKEDLVYKKVLNITNHQENAGQNYNGILSHIC